MVPSMRGTQSRHQAMIVGKEFYLATKSNLLSDCEAFGLRQRNAEEIYEQVAEQIAANWRESLADQGVADKGIAMVEGCFSGIPTTAPGER